MGNEIGDWGFRLGIGDFVTDSPQSSRRDMKQMIFRATISKKRIIGGIKK